MHKRWYDVDPAISLAVSLIQSANEANQIKCVDFIIDYAKQRGVKPRAHNLNDTFNYILRRWYDREKSISEAFDYFESSSLDLQKELALEIISLLQLSEA